MHLAGRTELAVGLEALLLLQGQLGTCRPAVGNVRSIDVPSSLDAPLEDNLQSVVRHLFLCGSHGDGILELRHGCGPYIYI